MNISFPYAFHSTGKGIALQNGVFVGLNSEESLLLQYAVAAHTHYTKESLVSVRPGKDYLIRPYVDRDEQGPWYIVWFPRWVDRLDCNGPAFPARHFLTLAKVHEEFDGQRHFEVEFGKHLSLFLRDDKEKKESVEVRQTMLEHLLMFHDSQNNESIYGSQDLGAMVLIRDRYKKYLKKIIDTVNSANPIVEKGDKDRILDAWSVFLKETIEPGSDEVVAILMEKFRQLPEEVQLRWCSGFYVIMKQYADDWYDEGRLETLAGYFENIPGLDVGKIISPNAHTVEFLGKMREIAFLKFTRPEMVPWKMIISDEFMKESWKLDPADSIPAYVILTDDDKMTVVSGNRKGTVQTAIR